MVSSPPRKNISLNTSGKSPLLIWPSRPTRGVAHVTNARWDAMDATASGAQGIAGRIELRERSSGARTNGAAKLPSPELAGTHEDRRELWRDGRGRRSRVVLTPPCWRQVWWRCIRPNRAWHASDIRKATVAKVQGSPGRSRISRKAIAQGKPDDPVHLWSTRAFCAHDRGCNRRPAFPAPFFFREG